MAAGLEKGVLVLAGFTAALFTQGELYLQTLKMGHNCRKQDFVIVDARGHRTQEQPPPREALPPARSAVGLQAPAQRLSPSCFQQKSQPILPTKQRKFS